MPLHLTDKLVAGLQCPTGRKDTLFFDDEAKGLGVRVTQAGGKVFLVQWLDAATKQKRREVLGAFGAITTVQARKAAQAKLGDVAKGLDPRAERLARAEAARKTKAAALTARIDSARARLKLLPVCVTFRMLPAWKVAVPEAMTWSCWEPAARPHASMSSVPPSR